MYWTPEPAERVPIRVYGYRNGRPVTRRSRSMAPLRTRKDLYLRNAHGHGRHWPAPAADGLRRPPRGSRQAHSQLSLDLNASTESLGFKRGRKRVRLEPDAHASRVTEHPRATPSITRRGAGMVLLGAWAMIGLRIGVTPNTIEAPGTVVGSLRNGAVPSLNPHIHAWPSLHSTSLRHPAVMFPDNFVLRRPPVQVPLTRKIGRVSAWVCTMLYTTSRLPQIWTNYKRRSVEGLSLFLFFAAFCANSLYSINVLASPKATGPGAHEFLSESIPFLLGSGGTLSFDLVIMFQWFMWHDEKRNKPHRSTYGATDCIET